MNASRKQSWKSNIFSLREKRNCHSIVIPIIVQWSLSDGKNKKYSNANPHFITLLGNTICRWAINGKCCQRQKKLTQGLRLRHSRSQTENPRLGDQIRLQTKVSGLIISSCEFAVKATRPKTQKSVQVNRGRKVRGTLNRDVSSQTECFFLCSVLG